MRRTPMPPPKRRLQRKQPLRSRSRESNVVRMWPRAAATTRDTGPSRKTRLLVLERDRYACVCCGVSIVGQQYSIQHRKRRSQGGDNSPANLVTVLGTGTTGCHERIDSRRIPEDEKRGLTVRSWLEPAEVPVTLWDGRQVRLGDDGRYHDAPRAGAA